MKDVLDQIAKEAFEDELNKIGGLQDRAYMARDFAKSVIESAGRKASSGMRSAKMGLGSASDAAKSKAEVARNILNQYADNLTGAKVRHLSGVSDVNKKLFGSIYEKELDVDIKNAKKIRDITRAATAAAALGVGGGAYALSKKD